MRVGDLRSLVREACCCDAGKLPGFPDVGSISTLCASSEGDLWSAARYLIDIGFVRNAGMVTTDRVTHSMRLRVNVSKNDLVRLVSNVFGERAWVE